MVRNSFFILILGLILTGCSASYHIQKAERKCPSCFDRDTTIVNQIIKRDTTIKIDTNIVIEFKVDTVIQETPIKKLKPYSFKPVYHENGIINAEVWMKKGILSISSWLDSTMMYRLEAEITLKDAIIYELRQEVFENKITIIEKENALNRFKKYLKWIIIGLVSLLFLAVCFRVYKWANK